MVVWENGTVQHFGLECVSCLGLILELRRAGKSIWNLKMMSFAGSPFSDSICLTSIIHYPFCHGHGSVENHHNWRRPTIWRYTHFPLNHDYGRKSKKPSHKLPRKIRTCFFCKYHRKWVDRPASDMRHVSLQECKCSPLCIGPIWSMYGICTYN